MQIGDVYRYGRPYSSDRAEIDGFRNFFHVVSSPGRALPLLESGINGIGLTNAVDRPRRPAVLIRSSPHRVGSKTTPWQDFFDPDNGHIRYYGDNKDPGTDPSGAPGNKLLL